MAQFKIYGRAEHIRAVRGQLSDVIHGCAVEALKLPADKRFQRFFPLAADDFVYPADRSARYTIIEVSMFEGRSVEARRQLVRLLFERLQAELGLAPADVEITITETPRHNWGIRGVSGDELELTYQVSV
ncbi:MAG TPA: tautomerase family protein [Roseiflexaceae bacterium]|nr:tautomerase family protein [Roseiflexaceae bacterium]